MGQNSLTWVVVKPLLLRDFPSRAFHPDTFLSFMHKCLQLCTVTPVEQWRLCRHDTCKLLPHSTISFLHQLPGEEGRVAYSPTILHCRLQSRSKITVILMPQVVSTQLSQEVDCFSACCKTLGCQLKWNARRMKLKRIMIMRFLSSEAETFCDLLAWSLFRLWNRWHYFLTRIGVSNKRGHHFLRAVAFQNSLVAWSTGMTWSQEQLLSCHVDVKPSSKMTQSRVERECPQIKVRYSSCVNTNLCVCYA